VFVAVLFLYSTTLALIVLSSIPFYLLIAYLVRPALRQKINERFNTGAASQQFLVESVFGIQTLKAAAVEPILRNEWDDRLAAYVKTSFQAVILSNLGQNAIGYVNKVTTAAVLFFGAKAVIDSDLTIGGLVAFYMIMNQATAPILRLSQLWQSFQQVQISVQRLGDILNSPPEAQRLASAHLPPMRGAVKISGLSFRYRPDAADVLRDVNLDIPAGQVLGIIGHSGSGKSTLTKLIQRLYRPDRGQVLIDGVDIGQVDSAWLRRQIGVVLQENVLFNRTIHENIALANPGMPRGRVIAAARLAGADEFIAKLALGYDTPIEERGANLSGGQRQRIAIARALATQPRILIFDEATSALDYESERMIQANMRRIVRGRTVIIIAHRLAAVRHCDRIIAIENGAVVEEGNHHSLLARSESLYARLWRLQQQESDA
jgi:ATP-binding cassette, subfamily B, bacterial HlyB/CyaB